MNEVKPITDKKIISDIKSELAKNGARDVLLFTMGINTGLRISDLLTLTVADVRDRATVTINEKKTGKKKEFPLNDTVQALLKPFIGGMSDHEFIFQSRKGENSNITRQQAYNIINGACKKCGITDEIGTHTLRKTFGYWHYKQNNDVVFLMKIFNHSAPSITLRYIGITQEEINASYNNFSL